MLECEVKYKVFDLTGNIAADPEEAQMLHERVVTAMKDGLTVELDFAGVELIIGFFLNTIIGELYEQYSAAEIDRLINFTNLNELGQDLLASVKRHATRYATFDQSTRQALSENAEKMYWAE